MDLSGLTGALVGIHVLLAENLRAPELVISETESTEFLARAQAVLRHYKLETTQLTLDWLSLIGAAGAIYGTRAVAMRVRRQRERAEGGMVGRRVVDFPRPRPREVSPGPPEPSGRPAAGDAVMMAPDPFAGLQIAPDGLDGEGGGGGFAS